MDTKKWSARRISSRFFYFLTILIALIFGAFYLVGFSFPYAENPVFNAPLFTDVLLWFLFAFLLLIFVLSLWSALRTWRVRDRRAQSINGVPVRRISLLMALFLVILLSATLLLGSSAPMLVNGKVFSSALWLKLSEMFVWTSAILCCAAVFAVACSFFVALKNSR